MWTIFSDFQLSQHEDESPHHLVKSNKRAPQLPQTEWIIVKISRNSIAQIDEIILLFTEEAL